MLSMDPLCAAPAASLSLLIFDMTVLPSGAKIDFNLSNVASEKLLSAKIKASSLQENAI